MMFSASQFPTLFRKLSFTKFKLLCRTPCISVLLIYVKQEVLGSGFYFLVQADMHEGRRTCTKAGLATKHSVIQSVPLLGGSVASIFTSEARLLPQPFCVGLLLGKVAVTYVFLQVLGFSVQVPFHEYFILISSSVTNAV
jgi:hypothetical protein